MKETIRLRVLGLFCSLAAGAITSQAALQLVENFEEIPVGNLNGQRGWSATLAQVKFDPENASNRVASFEGAGTAGANRPLLIQEGTIATLFFRAYSEADTTLVDWFAGVSDVAVTGVGVFPDFEAQIGYSGSQILDTLRVRDGSTLANEAADEFLPRTWYKIWAVIDNAADTYEVYIQGGSFVQQTQVTAVSTGNTTFVFRNSGAGTVANDLIRFFVKSGTEVLPGPALLDDVYFVTGRDLSDPVPTVNLSPTVAITAPASGEVFTGPTNITVRADAADTDGTVSTVEFFAGATLIGTATNPPFNVIWSNVVAGFYTLTAKATDNLGATRLAGAISITVNPTGTNNFVALDRFENATLGGLNGQSGWAAAGATVTVDPTQSNNKVASFEGTGGASVAAVLPEGKTGTLFFRAYSVSDTTAVDWCAGLSDMAAAGPGRAHTDFEAQICVAGAQTLDSLKVRDGSVGLNVDVEEFRPRTWYKVWMVIDNAIDQFEVYMQGGQLAEPTLLVWDEFGYSSFVFRNSGAAPVASDLVKFLVLTTAAQTGQFLLDDLYWDAFGKNLSDPVGALAILPTVAITAPLPGASFTTPTNIIITADAARTGGTISMVEFFDGTNLLGADATSPYSIAWSNVTAGAHGLTAKATDNLGGSQVSSLVAITVNQGAAGDLRIVAVEPDLISGNITLRWEGDGPQFQVEKSTTIAGQFQSVGAVSSARVFTDAGVLKSGVQGYYRVLRMVGGPECISAAAAGGFMNTPFAEQTGTFSVEFEATPEVAPIDSVMALSSGPQTTFPGFAVLVRFNPAGSIDARNGGAYAAEDVVPYSANVKYNFRLAVNVPAHTYSVFVTPQGGTEQTIGTDFAFRTEQNSVTALNHWTVTVASTAGANAVCDFRLP